MELSQFKDIVQKLNLLRNYSSLLLPIIIVVVSVLIFLPTQIISSKLHKQIISESISLGNNVSSLSRKVIVRDQWKIEQDYQQAYATDANQTALLAKQSTQRQLLSYRIFPEPADTSVLIFKEFGRLYRTGLDKLIGRINARDCPTTAEIERSWQGSVSSSTRKGIGGLLPESGDKSSKVKAAITDELCEERAASICVYTNPVGLSGYRFGENYEYVGMEKAIKDCWYWQLGYWVIEDVIDSIAATNASSNSVFTSPVKRLLAVGFSRVDLSGQKDSKEQRPKYVHKLSDGLTNPHTRRFSNDDIDVVHFNISVIVSARYVLPFMQQLCSAKQHKFKGYFGDQPERTFEHNQIAILESNISPIDRDSPQHKLYRYGDDAVVRLDLTCEYLFNRSGYDQIKPKSIKSL